MTNPSTMVGRRVPDFSLPCTRNSGSEPRVTRLADFQDRWLLLLFYPRDFTLICPTELTAVSGRIEEFQQRECGVVGISTDSLATHERWLATPRSQGGLGGLAFPLAADETGETCRAYGVYIPKQHLALRALFIIDPNGVLQYQVVHNLSVGRSTEEILRVLDALQTGGMCPADWEQGKAPLDLSQSLGPNHILGTYQIEAQIGKGAFGTVFRALDLRLERRVALKVRKPGPPAVADAVLAEARAAAALNHPNICVIHALEEQQGTPVIVMEYLDGMTLNELLLGPRLTTERALFLGRQIALGMAAAHAQKIVHGDLKPANIMVTADDTVKILDFGLARHAPPTLLTDETADWAPGEQVGISGTPAYMAPEQARGEAATPRGDVFVLGLILYEMVSGNKAIGGGHVLEALRQIDQLDPARYAAAVPEPFSTVLRQALITDPAERRITMAQIAASLA